MSEVVNVAEKFGKNVFNETVMRERLPKSVFKKLKKTIEDGAELDPSIADVVAHGQLREVPLTTPIGSSRLPVLPQKSMIPLSLHRLPKERSSWNSPEKNW